jgi:hypothetical protein
MLTEAPEMIGRFEVHRTPAGDVVYKEVTEDAHHYFGEIKPSPDSKGGYARVDTSRLTGVSTAAKFLDGDSTRLQHWAAKCDQEGIARIVAADVEAGRSLDWLTDPAKIAARLKAEKASWKDVMSGRAEEGTNVHHHTVWKLATGQDADLADLSESERGFGQGVFDSFQTLQPRVRYAEQLTVDHGIRIAGTFDVLGDVEVRRFPDGVPAHLIGAEEISVLFDYKTRDAIHKTRLSDHVQLKIYDRANRTCGIGGSDAQASIIVTPDGRWKVYWCEATEGDAAAAITACHSGSGLSRRVSRLEREARSSREAVMA